MIRTGHRSPKGLRTLKGFVLGELLMALLLLTVAVSSLAALMYSVSHQAAAPPASAVCSSKPGAPSKCGPQPAVAGASKLLRSSSNEVCGGRTGAAARDCVDSAIARGSSETVLVSRTDSAALAMARHEKAKKIRTDRGFIR
jgi:hypothetical protein